MNLHGEMFEWTPIFWSIPSWTSADLLPFLGKLWSPVTIIINFWKFYIKPVIQWRKTMVIHGQSTLNDCTREQQTISHAHTWHTCTCSTTRSQYNIIQPRWFSNAAYIFPMYKLRCRIPAIVFWSALNISYTNICPQFIVLNRGELAIHLAGF